MRCLTVSMPYLGGLNIMSREMSGNVVKVIDNCFVKVLFPPAFHLW